MCHFCSSPRKLRQAEPGQRVKGRVGCCPHPLLHARLKLTLWETGGPGGPTCTRHEHLGEGGGARAGVCGGHGSAEAGGGSPMRAPGGHLSAGPILRKGFETRAEAVDGSETRGFASSGPWPGWWTFTLHQPQSCYLETWTAPLERVPRALPSWDHCGQVRAWKEMRLQAAAPRAALPAWVSTTAQASAVSALGPLAGLPCLPLCRTATSPTSDPSQSAAPELPAQAPA